MTWPSEVVVAQTTDAVFAAFYGKRLREWCGIAARSALTHPSVRSSLEEELSRTWREERASLMARLKAAEAGITQARREERARAESRLLAARDEVLRANAEVSRLREAGDALCAARTPAEVAVARATWRLTAR